MLKVKFRHLLMKQNRGVQSSYVSLLSIMQISLQKFFDQIPEEEYIINVYFLFFYINVSMYLHLTSRKNIDKKQTNKITRSPDANILESTWEYEITKIDI